MRAALAVTVLAVLATALAAAQPPEPTGVGVTIAVLDTGVDGTHPELAGRVAHASFVQPATPIDLPTLPVALPVAPDPDGQGTAVASLAAGASLGVAKAAQVLDLQVSAKYSGGVLDPATEGAAIEAMDALLQDPARARVVLLSFAQGGVTEAGGNTLAEQAHGLWDAGVLVVVPTGPTANPLSTSPYVVTVAGAESCPGDLGPGFKPDLVAPSQDRTVANAGNGLQAASGTSQASGTALAAAQVAGAGALLVQVNGDLPVDALASYLRDAATDAGPTGPDHCTGFGALNVTAAVAWAAMWDDPFASRASRDAPAPGLAIVAGVLGLAAWGWRRRA